MRHKKGTDEAKIHGHPDNTFHTVETPGFSRSFYLGGEDIALLTAHLKSEGKAVNKSSLGELAHTWFRDMMKAKREARKNEFLQDSEISKEKA